jgi:hypothetical protein
LKCSEDDRDKPEIAESDFVKLRFADCRPRCLHSSPQPRCLGASAIGKRGVMGRSGSSCIMEDGALGRGLVFRLTPRDEAERCLWLRRLIAEARNAPISSLPYGLVGAGVSLSIPNISGSWNGY